jgi:hypothetical protein
VRAIVPWPFLSLRWRWLWIGLRYFVSQSFRMLCLHPLVTGQDLFEVVVAFFGDLPPDRMDFFNNLICHDSLRLLQVRLALWNLIDQSLRVLFL